MPFFARSCPGGVVLFVLVMLGSPAVAEAQCAEGVDSCYRAADGTWRDAAEGYRLTLGERDPDWLRASIEDATFVLAGVVWYWLDLEHNVADWDYDSWEQRLTLDAFRYDNNTFHMNWIFHPLSGSAWYAFPRANDLSPLESFALGFLASWSWEFLAEFKERISINDTLVTPAAGLPIGEFAHRLGTLLYRDPRASPILRWMLGFPVAFHGALDDVPAGDARWQDVPVPWHRFSLSYRFAAAETASGEGFGVHALEAGGSIVSIPGYLRAGRFGTFFHDADVNELTLQVAATGEGAGLELETESTLLGYHAQSFTESGGGLAGTAFTVGSSLSYLYRTEDHDPWRERIALLGLPGVALDGHVFAGPLQLHARGRLQGAFGGSHAAAWARWRDDNSDQTAKSILRKQGYYYGWGVWARLELEMELAGASVGTAMSFSRLDSHEGLDRTQDAITADVEASDERLELEAWLRLRPSTLPVFLQADVTQQLRTSRVGGLVERPHLTTWGLTLGVVL